MGTIRITRFVEVTLAMKRLHPVFCGLLLFWTLNAASLSGAEVRGLPVVDPAAAGMDAAQLDKIAATMQEYVQQGQISGAVTLVARDGKIAHLQAVGQADVAGGRAMQADTLFAIASMTKPITATAVMILQDQGRLSVDDPVSKYLPEFADVKCEDAAPARPITLRDLLTHTSGVGGSQQNEGTLQATAEAIARRGLLFQPGQRWSYSPGLTVCGRVVEVVSGQPFDEFLEERIFTPLGMQDTTFFPNEGQQKRLARLYKPGSEPGTIETTTHWLSDLGEQRTPNPSGGLFSTATDLARFYQMILQKGEYGGRRILSEAAVDQMLTPQTGDLTTGFTPGNGWGLGWCVVREPQGPTEMLSRGTCGHGGAFGTQGWIDVQRKMIVVLMIQRTGFGNADAADIRRDLQQIAVDARR
jgi:CubicO group peptidase (beta-lactamase class C family)